MERKEYNIVKNLMFSGISTFTTFFLFILLSFLGRILGSEEYGIFTTALSIATIFEMFTDFGLRDISIRNVSRKKELTGTYIGNLLVWKTLLCLVVYGAMIVIINVMGYDGKIKLIIYILTGSAFLKNMKYTFRIFFQAHDKFGWDTILVVMERVGLLAFGLAALFRWHALLPFTIVFASVRAVDFLITMLTIRWKIAPIKPRINFKFMKNLQIEAFPLGLFFVILTVFAYVDTVMLSLMKTYDDVGLYNAAFKIYEGITIMPTIFWLVFLPRLSELYTKDKGYHSRLSIKSVKYMFVTALPTMIYGIIFSDFLIKFFFKEEFTAAIITLQILFFGLMFQYPNWMLNASLISMNRQRMIMIFGFLGLGIKIVLNLIMIPLYSFNGSAVATVLSEFVIFAGIVIYLKRESISMPLFNMVFKPVVASAIIYVMLTRLDMIPIVPLVLLTACVYVAVILALKTFDSDEIDTLLRNIRMLIKTN
ncbi:MAG: flippase [candidate division KSB1 bacterium]|nr:flippase [candidate division KSB1 bacterium]